MSSKRKLNSFTLQEKMEIINLVNSGRKQVDVAAEKNISTSTVSDIWKNRVIIKDQYEQLNLGQKKIKKVQYEDIDGALLQWFKTTRNANIPLNGPIVLEKAKQLATRLGHDDFKGSSGWFDKWKKRHGITFRTVSGEAGSVDDVSLDDWLENKWPQLSAGYKEEDIFNCDETGLFYKLLPNKSLHFKNEKCQGGKNSKIRITVLLGTNSTGTEKIKPLIIGKSKTPRPFKSIKVTSLPVEYFNNKKAWMTSTIFESWLHRLDEKMIKDKRNILLTLGNCTAHPANISLKNVKLVFFQPTCTSKVQPCDQGIINEVKKKYRSIMIKKILYKIDNKLTPEINILEAIFTINTAWNELSASTIKNCFRHSRLTKLEESNKVEEAVQDDDEEEENILLSELAEKLKIERGSLSTFQDYVDCDAEVETCGMPSEDEIVALFQKQVADEEDLEEELGDELEEQPEVMTSFEFISCVNRMRHFVACHEEANTTLYDNLDQLERYAHAIQFKNKKQTKIQDYFYKCTNTIN